MRLRVSAISFLNPAPLLYDFEHEPAAGELRTRYAVHYTSPALCAAELHSGNADLGLIPVAELTPELRIVPGCVIASLREVRSILLLIKNPARLAAADALSSLRSIATDTASRSSLAYVRVLLRRFYNAQPACVPQPANPFAMLANHEAALLIGDPALIARERRAEIDAAFPEPLLWVDVAQLWHEHTALPWVAAVWAVRPEAIRSSGSAGRLIGDLAASRDNGLLHVEDLVRAWAPRLELAPATVRTYLTQNIHYLLDPYCVEAILQFRRLAAELGMLPPLRELPLL